MVFWWILIGVCGVIAGLWIYSMCVLSSKISRAEEVAEFMQEDLSEDLGCTLVK